MQEETFWGINFVAAASALSQSGVGRGGGSAWGQARLRALWLMSSGLGATRRHVLGGEGGSGHTLAFLPLRP